MIDCAADPCLRQQLGAVMAGWPGAAQDRLPAGLPDSRPGCGCCSRVLHQLAAQPADRAGSSTPVRILALHLRGRPGPRPARPASDMPCRTSSMLSTIPATTSLGSHSCRQDEIARSRAPSRTRTPHPGRRQTPQLQSPVRTGPEHHLHGVKATYRTDGPGVDRSGACLTGRYQHKGLLMQGDPQSSGPPRSSRGRGYCAYPGVGLPSKRAGLVVTAVRGCRMDRPALEWLIWAQRATVAPEGP